MFFNSKIKEILSASDVKILNFQKLTKKLPKNNCAEKLK